VKRYNLFMDTEQLAELKARAERESTTVSELIRQAVDKILAGNAQVEPIDVRE
jgi:hypothetical protein